MFKIFNYDHVGVRVTDRERSVKFYGRLGFFPEFNEDSPERNAIGLINDAGIRINLIYNGIERPKNRNILMDEAEKHPGFTHPAFVVDSIKAVIAQMNEQGISITEGPIELGGRRIICFIRDPDGNVLEFDELYE